MNDLMLHDLYVATADPERWGVVLKRLTEAVGGTHACFVSHVKAAGRHDGLLAERSLWGLPGEVACRRSLRDRLEDEESTSECPTSLGFLSVVQGGLKNGLTLRPGEFQFLWHNRIGHVAVVLVCDRPAVSRYFVIERALEDGRFSQPDECRLRIIGPHLRRAVGLRAKFQELRVQHQLLSDALDRTPYGLLMLTLGRSISWKNRLATEILCAGDGLVETKGVLHAATPAEDRRLQRLFSSLENPARLSTTGVRVSRPSGRKPYLVLACQASSDGSAAPQLPDTGAMLIVHDPEAVQAPPRARLIELFNLTPAEASLAASLIEGKKLDKLATQRSVKLSTLRSQLRAVLAKTEVAGQADLIRLLSPLPMI